MNIEKMREEFEAYKSRVAAQMIGGGEGKRVRQILERMSFSDFEAGWKASRESLVIYLPRSETGIGRAYIDNCRKSIEAQGLKVKP